MANRFSIHRITVRRLIVSIVLAMGCVASPFFATHAVCEVPSESDIDFQSQVLPILESHCYRCHAANTAEGDLRLDSLSAVRAGGHTGAEIIAATAMESELFRRIISADLSYRMPKQSEPLSASEIETIRDWIDAGAEWPEAVRERDSENPRLADGHDPEIEQSGGRHRAKDFQFQSWIVKSRFDFLLWWLVPGLILLGLVVLVLIDRQRKNANFRNRFSTRFSLKNLSLVSLGWLLLGGGLYQFGLIRELTQENQDLQQRLSQQMAVRAKNEGRFKVELDASCFDEPLHPMHPPRLGGVYYRGNDERSPELFNGGFYRTATMEAWLVDDTDNRLKWGDDIRNRRLSILYSIERAPGTTPALFTDEIMAGVFLKHHRFTSLKPLVVKSDPEEYRIELLDADSNSDSLSSMPKWTTQIPLAPIDEWKDGSTEGLIYIHQGNRMFGDTKGRVHFGIKYKVQIVEGKISPESELWMGSMYNLAGRAIVPAEGTILVDRWFDFRPMPEIEGLNTSDPKLLGIPEHQSGVEASGGY